MNKVAKYGESERWEKIRGIRRAILVDSMNNKWVPFGPGRTGGCICPTSKVGFSLILFLIRESSCGREFLSLALHFARIKAAWHLTACMELTNFPGSHAGKKHSCQIQEATEERTAAGIRWTRRLIACCIREQILSSHELHPRLFPARPPLW